MSILGHTTAAVASIYQHNHQSSAHRVFQFQLRNIFVALSILVFSSKSNSEIITTMNDGADASSLSSRCRIVVLPAAAIVEEILLLSGPFRDKVEEESCRVRSLTL